MVGSKWHQGPKWARLLKIYDDIAMKMYGCHANGESRLIPTKFGDTQVHTRGSPSKPALVFFHGIATNSLMFGDWLIPALSDEYFCVAIDTLGDMGRSLPRDGDPSNAPQTREEMAEWARDVLKQVLEQKEKEEQHKKVSIVGYSYGCFIGMCFTEYYPEWVKDIVLLAPAGVVAPVQKLWLVRAITFAVLSGMIGTEGFFANQLQHWFFGYMMADPESSMKNLEYPELRKATDAVGSAKVDVQPVAMDVDALSKVTGEAHPTLLIMGDKETVIDSTLAVENAKKAGMTKVKVYENAGHMLFCEPPRDDIIKEMKLFLCNH